MRGRVGRVGSCCLVVCSGNTRAGEHLLRYTRGGGGGAPPPRPVVQHFDIQERRRSGWCERRAAETSVWTGQSRRVREGGGGGCEAHAADVLRAKTLSSSIEGVGEEVWRWIHWIGEGVRWPWEERAQSTETRD